MLGLMALRPVDPDLARAVDVAAPQEDDLARLGAGEALQLDHRPDLARAVRPDRLDRRVEHRTPFGSGALLRPCGKPGTALSAWCDEGGTSSFSTAQRKSRTTLPTR